MSFSFGGLVPIYFIYSGCCKYYYHDNCKYYYYDKKIYPYFDDSDFCFS